MDYGPVVHCIHHLLGSRIFIEPIVRYLNDHGVEAEIWAPHDPQYAHLMVARPMYRKDLQADCVVNPITLLRRIHAYRKALRDRRPTIVHIHSTRGALVPLLAAAWERIPHRIYHNHGLPYLGYSGLPRFLLKSLDQINCKLATSVIFVSRSNRDAARRDGVVARDQGLVLGNGSVAGIDLTEYDKRQFDTDESRAAREAYRIDPGRCVVGFVGRAVRRKGYQFLLRLWEERNLSKHGFALLLAGSGPDDLFRTLGRIPEGVHAIGYIQDPKRFYAACDIVVLPSLHEGFGYGLLEAAAASRAVIGNDIPGIRCAVDHAQTGFLVSPANADDFINALEALKDKSTRDRLGAQGRLRVEQQFDRQDVLSRLLAFYRETCQHPDAKEPQLPDQARTPASLMVR